MWKIFNRKKENVEISFVRNTKREDATYKIVLGKDLKVGDIIVHNSNRCVITYVSEGIGFSGSFDFGGYISVKATKLTGQTGHLDIDFWTFEDCPVILENTDRCQQPKINYSEYDVITNTAPYAEDLGL